MLDLYCVIAAVLFVLSRLFMFALYSVYRNRSHFDFDAMKQLDALYIQEEWQVRHDLRLPTLVMGSCNALAWLLLAIPLLQVVWMQHDLYNNSHNANAKNVPDHKMLSTMGQQQHQMLGAHMAMVVFIIGGAVAEFTSHLLLVGANETACWLAKDFNLDDWNMDGSTNLMGWRTLEVVHWVIRGMLLWMDAAEHLFLFATLGLMFVSVWNAPATNASTPLLSKRWAILGLILSLICLLDFTFAVMRLKEWRIFSMLAGITSLLSTLTLFPIWLLWLGRQLYRIKSVTHNNSNVVLTPAVRHENDENVKSINDDNEDDDGNNDDKNDETANEADVSSSSIEIN